MSEPGEPNATTLFEARAPLGTGLEIRVSLREPNAWCAVPHLDLRIWTTWKTDHDGEGRSGTATRKGFILLPDQVEGFSGALAGVLADARARGLIASAERPASVDVGTIEEA